MDLATRTAWWSSGMYAVFGLDAAGGPSDAADWPSLLHPDDRTAFGEAYRRAVGGEASGPVRFRGVRRDGATRRLAGTMAREAGLDGAARSVAGCLHDATAHLGEDEELRASEDRLRRTVEGVDAIVVYRELGDQPLWFSEQLERILGWDPDALDNFDDWNAIVHPDDLPGCRAVWDAQPEVWTLEYRVRHADGRWVWVRDRGRRTPVSGSRPGGVFSLITDITELRALGERARQAERLEATAALASGLAHHFNNLLFAVSGYLEMAIDEAERPQARADLEADLRAARQAADRAAGLIRQLLAFARAEAGPVHVIDAAVAVRVIAPVLAAVLPPGVEVAIDAPAALGVRFERGTLDQILTTLARNAGEAMPDGGRLSISVCAVDRPARPMADGVDLPAGRYARIAVADTGIGMEPEVRGRVFEPFFTTKGPGAGLGMSLPAAYGLVRQAEGTIEVVSGPGRGTTVTIDLPLQDDA
ncbi:MAG TPA: PAS domain-containing protein [Candidatus Limnocylindrales bacterium]